MKRLSIPAAVAAVTFMLAGISPVQAQSTGALPQGLNPSAPGEGHFHEGELGEKLMLVETALKCNCGCGLDVHSCQFQMQCGTSPVWSLRIRQQLEAGESVDAVKASFVADYGTEVLMMPPAEGFNLLGYFLPAMAIMAAGALVGMVARGGATREALAPATRISADEAEKLEAAMRKLDQEESPDW